MAHAPCGRLHEESGQTGIREGLGIHQHAVAIKNHKGRRKRKRHERVVAAFMALLSSHLMTGSFRLRITGDQETEARSIHAVFSLASMR